MAAKPALRLFALKRGMARARVPKLAQPPKLTRVFGEQEMGPLKGVRGSVKKNL